MQLLRDFCMVPSELLTFTPSALVNYLALSPILLETHRVASVFQLNLDKHLFSIRHKDRTGQPRPHEYVAKISSMTGSDEC